MRRKNAAKNSNKNNNRRTSELIVRSIAGCKSTANNYKLTICQRRHQHIKEALSLAIIKIIQFKCWIKNNECNETTKIKAKQPLNGIFQCLNFICVGGKMSHFTQHFSSQFQNFFSLENSTLKRKKKCFFFKSSKQKPYCMTCTLFQS